MSRRPMPPDGGDDQAPAARIRHRLQDDLSLDQAALLKDEVFADEADRPRNPNKAIVADLIRRGVSIELCAQTMRSNGWEPEDVLPGVTIVLGAYPRIIDLQLRGFAYIRF